MVIEWIFFIIKFNVVVKNVIGSIFVCFEVVGFKIVGIKMLYLIVEQVCGFYVEYDGKLFFDGLVEFMIFGFILVFVLESENVVQCYCDLFGVINLVNVLVGMLCVDYVDSLIENGIYGLDLLEFVQCEIVFFFGEGEVCLCIC